MMTSTRTSSSEVTQSLYEDPDALMSAITDGGQSEVRIKPVPLPRSKIKPKGECNTTSDTNDTTSNTAKTVDSQLKGDCSQPCPVSPPPRPPPPDITPERSQSLPPRYQRPRIPSNYYDQLSTKRKTSEVHTDERHQSTNSSVSSEEQSPASPDRSEKGGSLPGCKTKTSDYTHRPVVLPRLRQPALPCATSQYENTPPQSKRSPPPIRAPTPPSVGTLTECLYSEIEYRPYLDILPDDDDNVMAPDRSSLRSGQSNASSFSSRKQTLSDSEDINVMLRWLKRVSGNELYLSLYGLSIDEEIRSFHERAVNLGKALRLYNLLMMKRHDSLQGLITEFTSISLCLDKVKKKNKTMGIAGGTTGAVGGVTAVVGIALAPVTMGISLIATAVGAGMVASAGGMGAHAAKQAKKKIVNKMTVEKLVYEYKSNVVDLEQCLDFILSGMNELRRHDIARLQRAGAQTDALKMAHLSQFVLKNYSDRKTSAAHTGGMSSERLLQVFARELDQYFTEKKDHKLRKSKRSTFSGSVLLLAENLQVELKHLNRMWEMFS